MKFHFKRRVKSTSASNPRYRVITSLKPDSMAAEAYRRIKVGLEYSEVDKKLQVIQVCSASQGEGKTTMLLNVAATYHEENKKVIVVDLDFRRPKVHRAFSIEDKNGVTDYLTGKVTLEEAIKHSNVLGFDCLNRGSKTPYPNALIGSEEMKSLFAKLKEMYDIILVDCPPALAVSDSSSIAPLTDGCIFVINKKVTDKNAAKEAVKLLRQSGVNLLGTVFLGIDEKDRYYSSKYYGRYYRGYYGYRDRQDSSDTPEQEVETEEKKEESK